MGKKGGRIWREREGGENREQRKEKEEIGERRVIISVIHVLPTGLHWRPLRS